MHQKGIVKLNIGGQERFLKIGTLSCAIFCELENINLAEMESRLKNQQPFTLINFVFAAASAYSRLAKEKIDYSADDVSEWIDQVDQDELIYLVTAAMVSFEEKKSVE